VDAIAIAVLVKRKLISGSSPNNVDVIADAALITNITLNPLHNSG
tara:strand:- start:317 stop:451 length:135 start_codon:yes stop_codon:yes gene_type:complete